MRESSIEQRLVRAVKDSGGLAIKLTAGGGLPDRLCIFPEGKMVFVEVKAPGERPRLLQTIRHEELRRLGFKVMVVDRPAQVAMVIRSAYEPYFDFDPDLTGPSENAGKRKEAEDDIYTT